MNLSKQKLGAIPTNIITGFLGVGKTTAILHLLKSKPATERWAVLVNEFGEIGVDGSLFEGQHTEEGGVFIREVTGGCMCCAAGLPMQIALNQLLARANPHRLLVEPTGLGHPKEVLAVLSAEHYRDVLDIQRCLTLVDARKLRDARYTNNDMFNQQIDVADIVIGNKLDLYCADEKTQLANYLAKRNTPSTEVIFTEQGKIDPILLHGSSKFADTWQQHKWHHHASATNNSNDQAMPASGYLQVKNSAEAYQSVGWRFSEKYVFNREALYAWLSGLEAERMKAVFITNEGIFAYNLTRDALTEMELDDCTESKLEIIVSADCALPELNWPLYIS